MTRDAIRDGFAAHLRRDVREIAAGACLVRIGMTWRSPSMVTTSASSDRAASSARPRWRSSWPSSR